MPVTKMIRKVIDPKTASHPHGPPRARAPRGSGIGSPNRRLQPVGFLTEDLAGAIVQVGFIGK
jgi:hypothetical protein